MGTIETLVTAVSEALKKSLGRKNLVGIVTILILSTMTEAPMVLCYLVAAIGGMAIVTRWTLDLYEVRKLGRDMPDNGNHQENSDANKTTGVPTENQ